MATTKDQIDELTEALEQTVDPYDRTDLLLQLAFLYERVDSRRAMDYALKAQTIAESLEDDELRARAFMAVANVQTVNANYSDAIAHYRKGLKIYRSTESLVGQGNALNSIGIAHKNRAAYADALRDFAAASEFFQQADDKLRLAAVFNNIGTVHDAVGSYDQALEAYLKALRIYEDEKIERNMAVVTGNVANIYYYLGDHERSLEYRLRALEIAERLQDEFGIAHLLGNLSSIHKSRSEYDRALQTLERAQGIFRSLGERRYEAVTQVQMASIQALQGKPVQAIRQMKKAAHSLQEIGARGDYCEALLQMGRIHLQNDAVEEAIEATTEALAVSGGIGTEEIVMNSHQVLYEGHRKLGRLAEAMHHLELYANLRESRGSAERQKAIADMQTRFDVERIEREREFFRERAAYMEGVADQRSKELSMNAAHLVRTNNLLQSLRMAIRKALETSDDVRRKALLEMQEAVDGALRSGEDWKRFEEMYQLVHHDFIHHLSEQCPDLSNTELKICALLNINLSNKEIGDLLCISARTVESHRYRIRKKLGLESDTNLSAYMTGLSRSTPADTAQ